MVGFVCAYGTHDPQWGSLIDNLHVLAAHKRTGIGATLMRRAGAWLSVHHPTHGSAVVRSCRYTWPGASLLAAA